MVKFPTTPQPPRLRLKKQQVLRLGAATAAATVTATAVAIAAATATASAAATATVTATATDNDAVTATSRVTVGVVCAVAVAVLDGRGRGLRELLKAGRQLVQVDSWARKAVVARRRGGAIESTKKKRKNKNKKKNTHTRKDRSIDRACLWRVAIGRRGGAIGVPAVNRVLACVLRCGSKRPIELYQLSQNLHNMNTKSVLTFPDSVVYISYSIRGEK